MPFQRKQKRSQREVSLISLHFETALILYPGSEAAEPRRFSFIRLESACQAYEPFIQVDRHIGGQYRDKGHVDRYRLVGSMPLASKDAGSTKPESQTTKKDVRLQKRKVCLRFCRRERNAYRAGWILEA